MTDTNTDTAVEVRDLVKRYPHPEGGEFNAVDDLTFDVRRGEILAVLGPNGAGKTTTLEIVEGLTKPTSGSATVLGLDAHRDRAALKQRIGIQLQSSSYFEHLTLEEILTLFGSFYERRLEPRALLERVGLADKRRALVGRLSGGQAQRFSIVAALVNDPEVVFLDEPTTGLDPQARRNLWDLVATINAEDGTTVVLTTHSMEEAERLSDRVAIVDRGRLIAQDTAAALVGSLPRRHRISFTVAEEVTADLRRLPGVAGIASRVNGVAVYDLEVSSPQATVPALFAWATDRRIELRDMRIASPSLEDVFLARTGNRLRD